ncbi:hypothetical protein BRARA_A00079 [Brassica rapa]|uniref:Uncharacterized protein n=1 Tax=Brassica campestris TaxID=3711 RepID=A0A398AHA9_BRACM|nr:hypothetical protein BRARA_A00079 [Brassica rapa]
MAATGEGRKQQLASCADGNAPLKYPTFKAPPNPSLTHTLIDVSPLLVKEEEEETAFPLRDDRPLVQDVCTISVLPDEGNPVPQCTSQFTLFSFVKALLPSKNQMFIDAQLNCQKTQNRINVLLGGTDSYQWRRYKRAASFDSRKIVILFSILSSVGTLILIYLTLRVRQNGDNSFNHM